MPLTPADVHNVAFSTPPIGKRGYNEDEVDAFLDLVEAELGRLIEENNDLREQVEQLEQQLPSRPSHPDAPGTKAPQAAGPAPVGRADHDGRAAPAASDGGRAAHGAAADARAAAAPAAPADG